MKYVCDVCGWEYDEELGAPDEGIEAGTLFEDLPEDFVCPLCGVGKDQFTEEQKILLTQNTSMDYPLRCFQVYNILVAITAAAAVAVFQSLFGREEFVKGETYCIKQFARVVFGSCRTFFAWDTKINCINVELGCSFQTYYAEKSK